MASHDYPFVSARCFAGILLSEINAVNRPLEQDRRQARSPLPLPAHSSAGLLIMLARGNR
ncbi:MAG: hypothetical protein GC204_09065 [Chloroflexi bacterium]|nr:hypothetical protein [Chloroflexota bacterium]